VLAGRLGWRITPRFVQTFCGRVLGNPGTLFDEEFLQPEKQDLDVFADGSIATACPPLQALLHLMRDGTWEAKGSDDPAFRALFTRESLQASAWYRSRLEAQRDIDVHLWADHADYLRKFLTRANYADVASRLEIKGRLERATAAEKAARAPAYLAKLAGTLGAEPAIAAALASQKLVP
jgi:hypothetical protein